MESGGAEAPTASQKSTSSATSIPSRGNSDDHPSDNALPKAEVRKDVVIEPSASSSAPTASRTSPITIAPMSGRSATSSRDKNSRVLAELSVQGVQSISSDRTGVSATVG